MASDPANAPVKHDEQAGRFEIDFDGQTSYVSYAKQGERMVIDYAYVPPQLRGRGLAERVVSAALEEARRRQWSVEPRCSYVALYIQRHKQYQDLLA